MSNDPWKNRSSKMKCKTCMWYAEKIFDFQQTGMVAGQTPVAPLGRCRRHAPTMTGYPVVFPTDWCGDHKLDETKL